MKKSIIDYLWTDRKRVLGLPLTFTKYSVSEDRLFVQTGFLNISQEEILLYRVTDLGLKVSLWQRIFSVGTVVVHSADQTSAHLELTNIKHPDMVKELLHKQIEEMKIQRKIRVGELLDDDRDDCCNDSDSN